MRARFGSQKGAILFIASIFCLMIASLMVYVLNLTYQQTRLVDTVGIKRTKNYYNAQAGIVDAFWRIRNNRTLPGWAGNFNDANFSIEYYIDIDTNTVTTNLTTSSKIRVSIGAKDVNPASAKFGLRAVSSVGLDV